MQDPMMDPSQQSESRMMQERPTEGSGGWKVDSLNLRPAANGGVIVSCSKSRTGAAGGGGVMPTGPGSDTYQHKDYAFGSVAEALAFAQQELGGGPAVEPDATADEAGAY